MTPAMLVVHVCDVVWCLRRGVRGFVTPLSGCQRSSWPLAARCLASHPRPLPLPSLSCCTACARLCRSSSSSTSACVPLLPLCSVPFTSARFALCCCTFAAMADKLDLDANPYEALGLGAGSADIELAEIKKARARPQKRCACLPVALSIAAADVV